jgi:hypothetical protein
MQTSVDQGDDAEAALLPGGLLGSATGLTRSDKAVRGEVLPALAALLQRVCIRAQLALDTMTLQVCFGTTLRSGLQISMHEVLTGLSCILSFSDGDLFNSCGTNLAHPQPWLNQATPAQLVQLAEVCSALEAAAPVGVGRSGSPQPPHRALLSSVCQKLQGRLREVDALSLHSLALVLQRPGASVAAANTLPFLQRQIVDLLAQRAVSLDADTLAACLHRLTAPAPIGGDSAVSATAALPLLRNITLREARAKLGDMSVGGLVLLLTALVAMDGGSAASQDGPPMHSSDLDAVGCLVFWLFFNMYICRHQLVLLHQHCARSSADVVHTQQIILGLKLIICACVQVCDALLAKLRHEAAERAAGGNGSDTSAGVKGSGQSAGSGGRAGMGASRVISSGEAAPGVVAAFQDSELAEEVAQGLYAARCGRLVQGRSPQYLLVSRRLMA